MSRRLSARWLLPLELERRARHGRGRVCIASLCTPREAHREANLVCGRTSGSLVTTERKDAEPTVVVLVVLEVKLVCDGRDRSAPARRCAPARFCAGDETARGHAHTPSCTWPNARVSAVDRREQDGWTHPTRKMRAMAWTTTAPLAASPSTYLALYRAQGFKPADGLGAGPLGNCRGRIHPSAPFPRTADRQDRRVKRAWKPGSPCCKIR